MSSEISSSHCFLGVCLLDFDLLLRTAASLVASLTGAGPDLPLGFEGFSFSGINYSGEAATALRLAYRDINESGSYSIFFDIGGAKKF